MSKKQILEKALEDRNAEVLLYEVNIENYSRGIAKIDATSHGDLQNEMVEFRGRLSGLLHDSRVELAKACVIRDVIADQIREIEHEQS